MNVTSYKQKQHGIMAYIHLVTKKLEEKIKYSEMDDSSDINIILHSIGIPEKHIQIKG